jgi:erythronate-4-phosphate dehydrogenase
MKILADEKIPCIDNYFSHADELVLRPGRSITRSDLLDVDMLIVRSVTRVDEELLQNTPVKFVGSVVAGADHLDTAWIDRMGIRWVTAAGSNSRAVVEYIVTIIAALQKMALLSDEKLRAGVIGVGRIGNQVATQLAALGFDLVLCDPIRAKNESNFVSTPLTEFVDLDLITIHTPLIYKGSDPTYHMIGKTFLQKQKKNCVLINAARGAVIDSSDLKEYGELLYWCLDVWENEPLIDFQALEMATIATPHIAGHTVQAKQRGIDMIYKAAVKQKIIAPQHAALAAFPTSLVNFENKSVDWRDVVLKIYDPRVSSDRMKKVIPENETAKTFDLLRNDFNVRNEFAYVTVAGAVLSETDKMYLLNLGIHKFE